MRVQSGRNCIEWLAAHRCRCETDKPEGVGLWRARYPLHPAHLAHLAHLACRADLLRASFSLAARSPSPRRSCRLDMPHIEPLLAKLPEQLPSCLRRISPWLSSSTCGIRRNLISVVRASGHSCSGERRSSLPPLG